MSQGVWKCDSCHSNNEAGATACHMCQRTPGSANGEVAVVRHQQLAETRRQQPAFVEYRPTITLTPVAPPRPKPVRPVAPPARPAAPPARPSSSKAGSGCALVVFGMLAVGIVLAIFGGGHNSSSVPVPTPPPTTTTAAGPTCPAAVARWLPAGGSGSTLVARYDAPLHVVTICQDADGQLYYDGQERGKPANDQYHISLRASRTSTGFEADNAGYRYLISGSELELTNNGAEVTRWPLTPAN